MTRDILINLFTNRKSITWVRRRAFVLGIIVGVIITHMGATSPARASHVDPVIALTHACTPRDTGGGVTMCANPTEFDVAFLACMRNNAYIGVTQEDTRHLFVQCVNDYMMMKGWR